MDTLDKISACAIAVLLVWGGLLILQEINSPSQPDSGALSRKPALQRSIDPNLEKKIALAKSLLAGGSLEKADHLVNELVAAYPFEGEPFMLKGDIHLRRQDVISAMLEYRKAVDLNPDYLDKKTTLFQGKKIKKTVDEAQAALDEEIAKDPDNSVLTEHKKTLYYMLRKIAGSCG